MAETHVELLDLSSGGDRERFREIHADPTISILSESDFGGKATVLRVINYRQTDEDEAKPAYVPPIC